MVLLEFAPENIGEVAARPTTLQSWPADAIQYASAVGWEPEARGGIPLVTSDFLRVYESHSIDYLTCGILKHAGMRVGAEATWRGLRRRLQRTLLPEEWEAQEHCEGIVHIAGHVAAVVLTESLAWAVTFLADMMWARAKAEVVDPEPMRRVCETVARWLIDEMRGTGARIERVRVLSGASSQRTITVFGRRGRGDFRWSVGAPDGDSFATDIGFAR
jgi:hypothetical protein